MNVATDMTKTRLRRHEVGERSHHGARGSGVDVEVDGCCGHVSLPELTFSFRSSSTIVIGHGWP